MEASVSSLVGEPPCELQAQIEEFYKREVDMDWSEMRKAEKVATEVSQCLVNALNNDGGGSLQVQVDMQGSVRDGLTINNVGDFDYLLTVNNVHDNRVRVIKPRQAASELGIIIPNGYTLLQYKPSLVWGDAIKDAKPSLLTRPTFGENDYVDAIKFKRYFISRFQRVRSQIEREIVQGKGYTLEWSVGDVSPALNYKVGYRGPYGEMQTVLIDLVPAIRHNVSKQPRDYEAISNLLWKEAFTEDEERDLARLSEDQKMCIRLVKAIKVKHNHLHWLSSYTFKALAINLDKKGQWPETDGGRNSLSGLFVFYLDKLISVLDNQSVRVPYVDADILDGCHELQAKQAARFLERHRDTNYMRLLQ